MSKKIQLCFALFLVFNSVLYAQGDGFYWRNMNQQANRLDGKLTGEYYYNSVIGNHYFFLHKEWHIGSVTLVDGNVFNGQQIRYLAFGDELISYKENLQSLFFKIDKDLVKEFTINTVAENGDSIKHRFKKYYFEGVLKTGDRYFEELYPGDKQLLAFHEIIGQKVNQFTDELGIRRDTEYYLKVRYYLHTEESGFERLYTKRRSFYKSFPEHKKEIRRLFRRHKIYLKSKGSMAQMFILMDQAGLL